VKMLRPYAEGERQRQRLRLLKNGFAGGDESLRVSQFLPDCGSPVGAPVWPKSPVVLITKSVSRPTITIVWNAGCADRLLTSTRSVTGLEISSWAANCAVVC